MLIEDKEEIKRQIAIRVIECLDEMFDLNGNIGVVTTHNNNPKFYTIVVTDQHGEKLGINIHKLK